MLRDLFSLFPAYAGVILSKYIPSLKIVAFPRICGGDPLAAKITGTILAFSPHMRG